MANLLDQLAAGLQTASSNAIQAAFPTGSSTPPNSQIIPSGPGVAPAGQTLNGQPAPGSNFPLYMGIGLAVVVVVAVVIAVKR